MKKRRSKYRKYLYILIAVSVVILLGFLLLNFPQKPSVQTPEQRIGELLSPALQKTYSAPLSLQNISFYQAGFTPAEVLGNYMLAFADDNNFTDTYQHLIQFQQGLNGITLNGTLAIDEALAESLVTATEEVRKTGKTDKEVCGYFNSLLNPSLLVMDLTLWAGKSEIYPTLQQYQDVGVQCEFYFPALNHGMFTYDPETGKIVQKTVFCDPSEPKSKCFSVWNYFWKNAVDQQQGAINYGAGCTLADWMMHGFICVKGVDLQNDRLIKNQVKYLEYYRIHDIIFPKPGSSLLVEEVDVKDSFTNALGASGKSIVDNVKKKCSQLKQKASKYNLISILAGGPGFGQDPTGGVIADDIVRTNIAENTRENPLQEYENAMLFASLFTEACLQDPSSFAADFSSSGGAGGFGLNNAQACLLEGLPYRDTGRRCVDSFGAKGIGKLGPGSAGSAGPDADKPGKAGIPDPECLKNRVAEPSYGPSIGRLPSPIERAVYAANGGTGEFDIVEDPELFGNACQCDPAKVRAFTQFIDTKNEKGETIKTEQDGPTHYQSGYLDRNTINHEEWHKKCPTCTEEQIQDLEDKDIRAPKTPVTPQQAGKMCGDKCKTFNEEEKKSEQPKSEPENRPSDPEGDKCSAQSQKVDAASNCNFEKEVPRKTTTKSGSTDPLGPDSDAYGGANPSTCGQAAPSNSGGGYFGTKEGATDDCLIGDFCEFPGALYGGSMQALVSKKCQTVSGNSESTGSGQSTGGLSGGLQCPALGPTS